MRGERARVADRVRELLGLPPADQSHRFRFDPGRRGAAAMGTAVLVSIAVTVWWLLSSRPQAVPVSAMEPPSAAIAVSGAGASAFSGAPLSSTVVASTAPTSAASEVVMDVAGRVRRPGIYRLPVGSRIYDAIAAAGGARPGVDLVALNLAAPVQDGQQIVVGRVAPPGAGSTGPAAVPTGSPGVGALVNLNTASLEQLDTLPGVGPVLAQHILDWRTQHGRFTSTTQLNDVSGIGDVKFAELRELVTV